MKVLDPSQFPTTNPVAEFVSNTLPPGLSTLVNYSLGIAIVSILVGASGFAFIYIERKVCAHIQGRLGPMRVGWHGILQTIADAIKLVLKEVIKPSGAAPVGYFIGPLLPITGTFLVLAVIPFDHHLQFTDLKIGVLYVMAVSGLGIFGFLIGGWSSNNKWSLLGAMRTGAQMVSYEISLALSMLLIVTLSGTASLREIVFSQHGYVWDWWIIKAPFVGLLAFLFFVVASTAELNRGPFDMAEAESELTAGFHTEYSGIVFALFFLAEFINMFVAGILAATFFLGGFLSPQFGIPFVDTILDTIPGFIWLAIKSSAIMFLFIWFRWSFPRLRVDQLMAFEWRFLLPATMANLVVGAVFVARGWILP